MNTDGPRHETNYSNLPVRSKRALHFNFTHVVASHSEIPLKSDVLHSDQQVVQLSEEATVAGDSDSLMGVFKNEPNIFPHSVLSSHLHPSPRHLHFSQEIQEGGGEGDLLRDTRKHTLAGEGEVSTGLLS